MVCFHGCFLISSSISMAVFHSSSFVSIAIFTLHPFFSWLFAFLILCFHGCFPSLSFVFMAVFSFYPQFSLLSSLYILSFHGIFSLFILRFHSCFYSSSSDLLSLYQMCQFLPLTFWTYTGFFCHSYRVRHFLRYFIISRLSNHLLPFLV